MNWTKKLLGHRWEYWSYFCNMKMQIRRKIPQDGDYTKGLCKFGVLLGGFQSDGMWGAGGFAGVWYHLNSWVLQRRLIVVLLLQHSQEQCSSGNVFSQTDKSETIRQEQLPPWSTHFSVSTLFLWDDALMLALGPQRYLFSLLAMWEPYQDMSSHLMLLSLSIWRLKADIC